jgi:chromosome segregation ATPase
MQHHLCSISTASDEKRSGDKKAQDFSALWDAHLALIGQMETQAHKLVDLEESLRNRVDRVAQLELQLDEERDRGKQLKQLIGDGGSQQQTKISLLEQRVNQLTVLCHTTEQRKSEASLALKVAMKKVSRQEDQLAALRTQLELAKHETESLKLVVSSARATTSIRGGGGRRRVKSPRERLSGDRLSFDLKSDAI